MKRHVGKVILGVRLESSCFTWRRPLDPWLEAVGTSLSARFAALGTFPNKKFHYVYVELMCGTKRTNVIARAIDGGEKTRELRISLPFDLLRYRTASDAKLNEATELAIRDAVESYCDKHCRSKSRSKRK